MRGKPAKRRQRRKSEPKKELHETDVSWGEEAQGSGASIRHQADAREADFAPTKEQGVSRMLTINLNDVEKELKIR